MLQLSTDARGKHLFERCAANQLTATAAWTICFSVYTSWFIPCDMFSDVLLWTKIISHIMLINNNVNI